MCSCTKKEKKKKILWITIFELITYKLTFDRHSHNCNQTHYGLTTNILFQAIVKTLASRVWLECNIPKKNENGDRSNFKSDKKNKKNKLGYLLPNICLLVCCCVRYTRICLDLNKPQMQPSITEILFLPPISTIYSLCPGTLDFELK